MEKPLREGVEGEKNLVSCIVATYRAFAGKEGEQETKTHIGFAWEKKGISQRAEEEPDAASVFCLVFSCVCGFFLFCFLKYIS